MLSAAAVINSRRFMVMALQTSSVSVRKLKTSASKTVAVSTDCQCQ